MEMMGVGEGSVKKSEKITCAKRGRRKRVRKRQWAIFPKKKLTLYLDRHKTFKREK